jgi:hypothetical protein
MGRGEAGGPGEGGISYCNSSLFFCFSSRLLGPHAIASLKNTAWYPTYQCTNHVSFPFGPLISHPCIHVRTYKKFCEEGG